MNYFLIVMLSLNLIVSFATLMFVTQVARVLVNTIEDMQQEDEDESAGEIGL